MSDRRRRARHDVTASPAERRRALRRRRARRGMVVGAIVCSLAVGGVAFAATRDTGPRYRTGTASSAAVEQTIEAVGTVASATRVDAAFSVAGTVGTVDVSVGDVVAAGDVLATLDLTSLEDALEEAESALAAVEQTLADDLDAQTSSSTSSSTTTPSTTTPSTTTPSTTTPTPEPSATPTSEPGGDSSTAAAVEAVAAAQSDLLAQYVVAADLATTSATLATTSRESLAASKVECETFLALALETDPVTDPETGLVTDPVTDPETTAALVACQDAQTAVDAAQTAVDAAQTAVDDAQKILLERGTALDGAVTAAQTALKAAASTSPSTETPTTGSTSTPTTGSTSTPTTSSTSTPTTSSTSTPTTSGPTVESETSVPSSEDILADRAAIDAAAATVEIARAELGMATLTSSVAGTVGAISIAPGDAVTASSTTAVISILGDAGHTVTMTVSLSVIDTVAVGQLAEMTVASTDEVLTGTVSSIGILDVSDSSTPAYTVAVTLDPTDARLFDGASAQVTITVSGNDETLTVPTSAVHVDGATATVTVLRDGEPVVVDVETGAVGDELTEILSGLAAGDEVVLADLSEPLAEGEDTDTDTGLSGLGGDSSSETSVEIPGGGMMPPSFNGNGG